MRLGSQPAFFPDVILVPSAVLRIVERLVGALEKRRDVHRVVRNAGHSDAKRHLRRDGVRQALLHVAAIHI